MTVFVAGGIWGVWYGLLWLTVLPFVVMLLWTLLRVSKATSSEESTWLNGAVLAGFFSMIVTSLLSVVLYVRAQADRSWVTYLVWLALHFIAWTFLGSGVFFASLQALAAGPRIGMRRIAAVLAVLGVAVIHLASLYATYRFRTR
jgi:hypothetical protein